MDSAKRVTIVLDAKHGPQLPDVAAPLGKDHEERHHPRDAELLLKMRPPITLR
ncbi:MAG: hypothetical protein M3Y88_00485 [Chloroflexota bacterium]|nr:hypothetical protein [Chloroflexota bacterium]